jgi:hypothetical protein
MSEEVKKVFGTKIVKTSLIVLGAIIIILVIFWSGMMIGFHKAGFNYQLGQNYHELFEGPERHLSRDFRGRNFMDANSAIGLVIKIDTSTLLIKGDDGMEKSILISDNTSIRRFQDTILPSDIKIDERVIILGAPSTTGQIEARLIRVMPKMSRPKL